MDKGDLAPPASPLPVAEDRRRNDSNIGQLMQTMRVNRWVTWLLKEMRSKYSDTISRVAKMIHLRQIAWGFGFCYLSNTSDSLCMLFCTLSSLSLLLTLASIVVATNTTTASTPTDVCTIWSQTPSITPIFKISEHKFCRIVSLQRKIRPVLQIF